MTWARNWMSEQRLFRRFPRFLLAGAIAALANFGSRFLFSLFISFELAVVAAFCVGLTTGFLLSRQFVFPRSANKLQVEVAYYLLVNLFALMQTWLLSVGGAMWLQQYWPLTQAQAAAHLAGIMLPVISSYFGHKYFSFRETPGQ